MRKEDSSSMATQTRSRIGFSSLNMPAPTAASADDRSQPQSMTSAFPNSTLYATNSNIWNSSFSNARDRSLGSHGASDDGPSASNAANAGPQANAWTSKPWNTDSQNRSLSTSPTRTRDGHRATNSGFFDQTNPASIGVQNGTGIGGRNFQDQPFPTFGTQRPSPQNSTLFEASVNAFPPSRDASAPPSRHSQTSPAFNELYRSGHTPSNSVHSRQAFNGSSAYSAQAANQRAYNTNRQHLVDEDLSMGLRRVTLENAANGTSAFNPTTQPFQLNAGNPSWSADAPPSRLSNGSELNADVLAQLAAVRRQSVGRASPIPSYRLESNNSPSNFAPTADPWISPAQSARDPRTNEIERRALQQQLPEFLPGFYPGQYPYGHMPSQYPANFAQGFPPNFRNSALHAHGYPMQAGYLPGMGLSGLNLPNVGLSAIQPAIDHDPARKTRSRLLDEFRQSSRSSRRFELRDIYNHVVEFSGDQHGSRFIQQKLETANSDEKDQVFREIEPNAVQLMKDVFGNYVVQKFFDHGNQAQKRVLAEKMRGKVLDLSVQTYACRVVQKAFEHVLVEQQVELVQEIAVDPFKVIRDSNGNHVVQKMIEVVPREHLEFIMTALRGQISSMAVHAYGCRVIQRMLERGTQQDKVEIMTELDACVSMLIGDQYGNYVAQHVIERGTPEDSSRFIELVLGQVLTYSKHKFASNVVEKCFVKGTPAQRSQVRRLLTTPESDGSSPLLQLARDQYGNYVIQKLLDEVQGDERAAFEEDIRSVLLAIMKNGTLGRQLHTLARRVGLDVTGSPSGQQNSPQRNSASGKSSIGGVNTGTSAAPTPVLTNETNTPQSSSPPSTHASADGVLDAETQKTVVDGVQGSTPQVQET